MGRKNLFNASMGYLSIDQLSLKYFKETTDLLIENDEKISNTNLLLILTGVLASILLGYVAVFTVKKILRPPNYKFFDDSYRAKMQTKLNKYTFEF